MTNININAERIYITAKQIYIIALAINVNRLGSFMLWLVIFIFYEENNSVRLERRCNETK